MEDPDSFPLQPQALLALVQAEVTGSTHCYGDGGQSVRSLLRVTQCPKAEGSGSQHLSSYRVLLLAPGEAFPNTQPSFTADVLP